MAQNVAAPVSSPTVSASRDPRWDNSVPRKLATLVSSYDLPSTPQWRAMDELSTATTFEGIEVSAEDAVVESGTFVAPGTVYVRLIYDPNSDDSAEFSDSYPARIFFNVEGADKDVIILRIEIDNSSFYE